jgi:hypothetical protein
MPITSVNGTAHIEIWPCGTDKTLTSSLIFCKMSVPVMCTQQESDGRHLN